MKRIDIGTAVELPLTPAMRYFRIYWETAFVNDEWETMREILRHGNVELIE